MSYSKQIHSLTDHIHGQQEASLRTKNVAMSLKWKTLASCYANMCVPHLQSKLVEEVVEEVLNTAQHTVVKVTSSDVMKQRSGGGRDFVMAKTVELLVSVNGHLEG